MIASLIFSIRYADQSFVNLVTRSIVIVAIFFLYFLVALWFFYVSLLLMM
jgi:hypothetical protein